MSGVFEVNDPDAFGPIRDAWWRLHGATPRAAFFETPDWFEVMWPAFPNGGRRPRVVVVGEGSQPTAVVPLCVVGEESRVGKLRVLTDPLEGWASAWTPLAENPTTAFCAALRHATANPCDWDSVDIRWPIGVEPSATEPLHTAGVATKLVPHERVSVVRCDRFESWEGYLATRSKKVRHELRRKRRRILAAGRVEHQVALPTADCPGWDAYDACVAVASRSWQAESGKGHTLCTDFAKSFFREAHERAARLGMVQIDLLRIDGRPVAYFYSYRSRGDVIGMRMGFDRAAPRGVGSVLSGYVIQGGIERGDWRLELGPGTERFKRELATDYEVTYRLIGVRRDAWRARFVHALRRLRHGGMLGQAAAVPLA